MNEGIKFRLDKIIELLEKIHKEQKVLDEEKENENWRLPKLWNMFGT